MDLMLDVLGLRVARSFVTEGEFETLARYGLEARVIVEVGVAEGATSERFLNVMEEDSRISLVDPYPARLKLERTIGVPGTQWIARRRVERRNGRAEFVSVGSVEAASSWDPRPPSVPTCVRQGPPERLV